MTAPLSPWSLATRLMAAATVALLIVGTLPAATRLAVAAGPPPGTPGADRAALKQPHARGRVIVGFEPGAGPVARGVAVTSVETQGVKRASPLAKDTVVVKLAPGQSVEEAIAQIGSQPGVAYVEPDYRVFVAETSDDPYYLNGDHWGMYGDATTPANAYGSGAGEAWAAGYTGSASVYVGVIDEGIQVSHPDLAANVWTNPGELDNGVDDDGNGYIDDIHGFDFYHDDGSVFDGPNGSIDHHGTHVAGTVGARGGNGSGVAGVNWQVGIISAKFIHDNVGWTSDAVQAIDYITYLKMHQGVNVVATNNSWGGGGYSQALLDAIDRAGDADILFVAAAGNNGRNLDADPSYPASFRCTTRANGTARGWDCLVSVANIEEDGSLNASSNRGATSVDLGAPGSRIVSTIPGGYAYYWGTSMAAPHVTGALALCSSIDPALTPRQLRNLLLGTVAPTGSLAGSTVTGGRLDIGALASACASGEPAPAATVSIDELQPGFERAGSGWRNAWSGKGGHHYWVRTRAGAREAYGTWRPELDSAGRYEILAWIPRQPGLSAKARYRVRTSGGWVSRTKTQARHRGTWMSLGVYELSLTPSVRLADATGEGGSKARRLVFDRLRFVPSTAPATVTAATRQPGTSREPAPSATPVGPEPSLEPALEPSPAPATPEPTTSPAPTSRPEADTERPSPGPTDAPASDPGSDPGPTDAPRAPAPTPKPGEQPSTAPDGSPVAD